MRGLRESLKRARHELDEAIEILNHEGAASADDDELTEVRSRLAALESRVSVIESQREDR